MQDVLGLGREARMNLPGRGAGQLELAHARERLRSIPAGDRLARLTWLYRRRPDQAESPPRGSRLRRKKDNSA